MPLPNQQITDANYRYAFQGQEKDPETGMEAFELRLWDGRLGRWLTVDPMGQYASPYLGMGNNPISRIDPDGGMDGDPTDPPVSIVKNTALTGAGIADAVMDFTIEGVIVNQVVPRVLTHLDKGVAFTAGFLNAFGSNFFLGGGRQSSQDWSNEETRIYHQVGQLGGDIASIVWGAFEFGGADAMVGVGILGAPETGGASLALVPAAAGVKTHGAVMSGVVLQNTLSDIQGLYDSFSKGTHSGGDLPSIDRTGKVHGELISPKDFHKYSKEELEVLLNQLKASVQKRIKVTTKLGRDRAHGQRQGAEHDLIKSLEKYLSK